MLPKNLSEESAAAPKTGVFESTGVRLPTLRAGSNRSLDCGRRHPRRARGPVLLGGAVAAATTLCLLAPAPAQNLAGRDFPAAAAQNGKLAFSFEDSTNDWRGLEGGNGVKLETKPIFVKQGKGALRYEYPLRKGAMSVLCRGGLSVAGAKAVSLWVMTSRPTMVVLSLIERDGSNYLTMFGTPPNAWQRVAYDLDEFRLADDSTDENGALDADQIVVMALADGQMFAVAKGAALEEQRTAWIDEVVFSPEATRPPAADGRALVEGFEEPNGRWTAIRIKGKDDIDMTAAGMVTTTTEPANVKSGKGALQYEYRLKPGNATALFGSVTLRAESPRSLSVWVKSAEPTLLAWILSERDGSRYLASIASPGGAWRQVHLALAEFALDKQAKDENGQLDPEQVNSMGFVDAAAMLGQAGGAAGGTRTLWLDEIVAHDGDPPAQHATRDVAGGRETALDDFERGAADWLSLTLVGLAEGKPALAVDKNTRVRTVEGGAAQGKSALEAAYFAPEGGLVAFTRSAAGLNLDGATQLRLWIKSKYDAKLLIQLEEKDGSGYNRQLDVLGSEEWTRHQLLLAEFTLADDKVDENGKLDTPQLKQFMVADLSGVTGEPGENVLWLDDMAFFTPAAP